VPAGFHEPHVAGCAGLDLLRDFRLLDALRAESAFFHDAAHSHRYVRVFDHFDQIPFVLLAHAAGVGRLEPAQQIPFAIGFVRQRRE